MGWLDVLFGHIVYDGIKAIDEAIKEDRIEKDKKSQQTANMMSGTTAINHYLSRINYSAPVFDSVYSFELGEDRIDQEGVFSALLSDREDLLYNIRNTNGDKQSICRFINNELTLIRDSDAEENVELFSYLIDECHFYVDHLLRTLDLNKPREKGAYYLLLMADAELFTMQGEIAKSICRYLQVLRWSDLQRNLYIDSSPYWNGTESLATAAFSNTINLLEALSLFQYATDFSKVFHRVYNYLRYLIQISPNRLSRAMLSVAEVSGEPTGFYILRALFGIIM